METAKSPEVIIPSAFDVLERQQSAKAAIFNLISTMIGGGVLSLPFAVSRSGLIIGFLMLTISAVSSIFSFDILISASRRTGSMTYSQIGYFAFDQKLYIQHIVTFLIWCLTYLASIAYCVLVGDLMKPIVCFLGGISETQCSSPWLRRGVILCAIAAVSPFCFMRQIKALKYTSIISIASCIILAVIITSKTVSHFGSEHTIFYIDHSGLKQSYAMHTQIELLPRSIADVIYVFPVFFLSFMCHFNLPQVHCELTRPTRKRMRLVLVSVVLVCYVLYATVAFFGYFFSFGYTCGNILLNYSQDDWLITVARFCLALVVLLSFPLLILPARASMHNLLNLVLGSRSTSLAMNLEDIVDSDDETEEEEESNTQTAAKTDDVNVHINVNVNVRINVKNLQQMVPVHKKTKVVAVSCDPMASLEEREDSRSKSSPSKSKSTHTPAPRSDTSHTKDVILLSYNTFNTHSTPASIANNNGGNQSPSTKLLAKKRKQKLYAASACNREDSVSSIGTERSYSALKFKTRSISDINAPLRAPEDSLAVIHSAQDAFLMKDSEFMKSFQNIENVQNFTPTTAWLIGETTFIIALSLLVAFLTESVMVVWAIVGSTVSFVIAFTLPGIFYLRIRKHKKWSLRKVSSMLIAALSGVAIIVCTWQAMTRLHVEPCPVQPYA